MVVLRSALTPASCPCRHPCAPTRLEWTSSIAQVDYYRCDECGHVWTVPRPLSERTIPTPIATGGADITPAAESVTLRHPLFGLQPGREPDVRTDGGLSDRPLGLSVPRLLRRTPDRRTRAYRQRCGPLRDARRLLK